MRDHKLQFFFSFSQKLKMFRKNNWFAETLSSCLKVPKREIFDRSDFPDFYTIKSLRVGDFRVKI